MKTTIRNASEEDLSQVLEWLLDEQERYGESFYCNRNLITSGQRAGELTVLACSQLAYPVAFALGKTNIDIVAVHPDHRRHGFGRSLALHCIEQARQLNSLGLHGECVPQTSKPFWLSLGFVPVTFPGRRGEWVALSLPQVNNPTSGQPAEVWISVDGQVAQRHRAKTDGWGASLHLDFVAFVPNPNTSIHIWDGDRELFYDKAKYLRQLGGELQSPWLRIRELHL